MNSAVLTRTVKGLIALAVHGLVLITLTASAIDMLPYSLRQTWYIDNEEPPYWEIRVTCSDQQTYRYMVRYDESKPWCAKQASDLCYEDKLDLAFEICKESYTTIIAENNEQQLLESEEVAQQDRLRKQLLEQEARLQTQRADLNKRKIELERRERELRAREVELNERKSRL